MCHLELVADEVLLHITTHDWEPDQSGQPSQFVSARHFFLVGVGCFVCLFVVVDSCCCCRHCHCGSSFVCLWMVVL